MDNIYLIESDDEELIKLKLQEILKDNISDLITYDLEETNIIKVIEDLDTISLFNEKKIIYAKHASFLTTKKCEIDHNVNEFMKYLDNPNINNTLIISCSKTDGKKNIVKKLKDKATIVSTDIDLDKFVKKYINDYKMSSLDIKYFLSNTGIDIERIKNELDKLLMYKTDTKTITKEDIDLVVIKKIDMNIFDLIDAIITKDKKKSITIYNEMINYGEDVFKIMIALSNQIRLIYQVKVLENMSNDDICDKLNLKNPKQVMAIRYKIGKYKEETLLKYLYKLSIMDEELKTGKAIDKIVFPTFIASL